MKPYFRILFFPVLFPLYILYQFVRKDRCKVCGKVTTHTLENGAYICEPCEKERYEHYVREALEFNQAMREATTPPGLSAEALWLLAFVLFIVYLCIR